MPKNFNEEVRVHYVKRRVRPNGHQETVPPPPPEPADSDGMDEADEVSETSDVNLAATGVKLEALNAKMQSFRSELRELQELVSERRHTPPLRQVEGQPKPQPVTLSHLAAQNRWTVRPSEPQPPAAVERPMAGLVRLITFFLIGATAVSAYMEWKFTDLPADQEFQAFLSSLNLPNIASGR
jgi:hypothetical protein